MSNMSKPIPILPFSMHSKTPSKHQKPGHTLPPLSLQSKESKDSIPNNKKIEKPFSSYAKKNLLASSF